MGPRVTIVDVAREAGVAISTVSAALNGRPGVSDQTRQRVTATAERMGWVPSVRGRSLSAKKTFSVGMVIERDPRVLEADPFFWGFISGLEEVLDSRGYALVLRTAAPGAQALGRIRELALGRGIDGMLLTDVRHDDPRYALLAELGLPAVAVNVPADESPVPTVTQDHAEALHAVMDLLVGRGHRRIAHLAGPEGLVHSLQREQVWRQRVRAAGLADDLLFRGAFSTGCGAAAAAHLLGRADPPTAVVCANDLSALGFMAGVRAMGLRVPDDVSVTGFDGIAMGQYSATPLTTVRTSPPDLGRRGADLLLDAIDGRPRSDVTIHPAELLLRDSVAAPRPTSPGDG